MSRKIIAAWNARRTIARRTNILFRIGLVMGGSCAAGIAQYCTWPDGGSPSATQVVGIVATCAVFFGGLWILGTDYGAEHELTLAAEAIEEARKLRESAQSLKDALAKQIAAYEIGRSVAETVEAMLNGYGTDEDIVKVLLEICSRNLSIAAGFVLSDTWFIGIYKAHLSQAGGYELALVDATRTMSRPEGTPRRWVEGKGVPGVCFQRNEGICVPDIQAPEAAGLFDPVDSDRRPHDKKRFRSALAYPVRVGTDRPWGCLVATSDAPGHFSTASIETDQSVSTFRDFASLIALVLALRLKLADMDGQLSAGSGP